MVPTPDSPLARIDWAAIRGALGLRRDEFARRLGVGSTTILYLERQPNRRPRALLRQSLDRLIREMGAQERLAALGLWGLGSVPSETEAKPQPTMHCYLCNFPIGAGYASFVGYVCSDCDEERQMRRRQRKGR